MAPRSKLPWTPPLSCLTSSKTHLNDWHIIIHWELQLTSSQDKTEDTMHNCDNLAIDSGLSKKTEAGGVFDCCFWHSSLISFLSECGCCFKVCPHFFLLFLALRDRQAQDSLCLDVLITWLLFLHAPTWTKGKDGGCSLQHGEQFRPPPLITVAEGAAD